MLQSQVPYGMQLPRQHDAKLATKRNHDVSDRLDGVTNGYGSRTQSFGVTEFDDMNPKSEVE